MRGCPSCTRISRRRLLDSLSGWAALSLLADHGDAQVAAADVTPRNSAKACVFINMDGAPSHVDTFDVKDGPWNPPDANLQQSGPIVLSRMFFPRLSRYTDDLCLLRSVSSWEAEHGRGQFYLQTAHPINPAFTQETPHIGAVAAYELSGRGKLPPFLSLNGAAGQGATFLGGRYEPMATPADAGGFRVLTHPQNPMLFEQKFQLLRELEAPLRAAAPDPLIAAHADFYEAAKELMHDEAIDAVFRSIPAESQRYGNTRFGNACIVARNAIRARNGAAYINIRNEGWDTHFRMFDRGYSGNHYQLCATLDAGVGSLIEDLRASGHLDETLIVMMGEFGRTPGPLNNRDGRDHHKNAMSVVMAGGGVRGGRVIGATDAIGDKIIDPGWSRRRPIYVEDIACTIFSALGINWTKRITDTPSGRIFEYVPRALPGVYEPVQEVFG